MEIKGIANNAFVAETPKNTKSDSASSTDPKDKIVISAQARDLAKTELSSARIAELRERVNSGFYDSDEVLEKVSEKILNELNK
jgi:anti-sigma28 factor (negative regulator of flagellin synthesis)